MNGERIYEQKPLDRYFGALEYKSVVGWMSVVDPPVSKTEVAIVTSYFNNKDQQDVDDIAASLGLSADELHAALEMCSRLVNGVINENQDLIRKASQTKKEKKEKTPIEEKIRTWGSAAIDMAAALHVHPSALVPDEAIHTTDAYACKDLKPGKRHKFTSRKAGDQLQAAQRYCLHCELSKQCGKMALEMQFKKGTYGGMTESQRADKARQIERQQDPKKKKKKK